MFGVKGNVALAGVFFCCQHLFRRSDWNEKLIRIIFWSLQLGIILMMTLDLFPVGLYQLAAIVSQGFWYGRTNAFVTNPVWRTLTWLRSIGGMVFLFGGVMPLTWFILSRARRLVPEVAMPEGEWTVYDQEQSPHEQEIEKSLQKPHEQGID